MYVFVWENGDNELPDVVRFASSIIAEIPQHSQDARVVKNRYGSVGSISLDRFFGLINDRVNHIPAHVRLKSQELSRLVGCTILCKTLGVLRERVVRCLSPGGEHVGIDDEEWFHVNDVEVLEVLQNYYYPAGSVSDPQAHFTRIVGVATQNGLKFDPGSKSCPESLRTSASA